MPQATAQDRSDLIRRAESRKTRRSAFRPGAATKWHPTSLRHPTDGEPFTPDNCWAFIAEAIKAGAAVEVIVLKHPPGKRGFVMLLDGHGETKIYVKLQLLSDVVLGRSFHESTGADYEDD